jgi:hypothetical protein
MLSKWKKDYREGRLKPAASAADLSLPKVLRAPKADAEKRSLKRQVRELEAKVQARREVLGTCPVKCPLNRMKISL